MVFHSITAKNRRFFVDASMLIGKEDYFVEEGIDTKNKWLNACETDITVCKFQGDNVMDELHKRGKALEDMFFKEQEVQVIEKMRAQLNKDKTKKAIMEHTGVQDGESIDKLIAQGISVATLAAIRFVPLVLMSWASGRVEAEEQEVLLNHLHEKGVALDSPVRKMVMDWLVSRPTKELEEAWTSFVSVYLPTLTVAEKTSFASEILEVSHDIADSAGGFLGFGSVCKAERELLNRLHAILDV